MKVGVSQVDITPEPGVQLCGFAARTQPSTGVMDSLYGRCLYLEQGGRKLLWVHADVIGLERDFVEEFRAWAAEHQRLEPHQVMVSATHTHSAPATVRIQEAGDYEPGYVELLCRRLKKAAVLAMANTEECGVVVGEGRCDLAIDRRAKASAKTDPRVGAVGWRRADGTFAAVLMNHPMHAVALGHSNRQISADVPGRTAAAMSSMLPGNPVVLVTNGACGNLNPPAKHVSFEQIDEWGRMVAGSVADALKTAAVTSGASLRVAARVVPLPVDVLTVDQITAYAERIILDPVSLAEWGDKFRRATKGWRSKMTERVQSGAETGFREAELFGVGVGSVAFVGLNSEVFSEFTELVRSRTSRPLYVVGYANGVMGYLPTRAAYEEGGYEVETAYLFYNDFRPKIGGLEMLAEQAAELVNSL